MKKNYIKPMQKPYDMGPVSIMEGSPAQQKVKKNQAPKASFFDDFDNK